MSDQFNRFTKRARRVLILAQQEAQRLNNNYIGTEHLLLGLVCEENSMAVRVLRDLGINPSQIREQIERTAVRGQRAMYGKLSLTSHTKRMIELAVDEKRRLGHHYLGTEHLLLGLVKSDEGVGADVLKGLGVSLDKVRTQVESRCSLCVFLCHSSNDKPMVRDLYSRLSTENYIDPWLDEQKILPGQDWDFEIKKAIRESNVVIVCLSHSSISKEGYIQKEIVKALEIADEKPEGTIFIIPLRLEECQVPLRLSRWQWVDLFEDGGYERLMLALQHRASMLYT